MDGSIAGSTHSGTTTCFIGHSRLGGSYIPSEGDAENGGVGQQDVRRGFDSHITKKKKRKMFKTGKFLWSKSSTNAPPAAATASSRSSVSVSVLSSDGESLLRNPLSAPRPTVSNVMNRTPETFHNGYADGDDGDRGGGTWAPTVGTRPPTARFSLEIADRSAPDPMAVARANGATHHGSLRPPPSSPPTAGDAWPGSRSRNLERTVMNDGYIAQPAPTSSSPAAASPPSTPSYISSIHL